MIDKQKVKKLYSMGFNSKEISNIINCTNESVKKCIQRNFSDSKLTRIHKENRIELKSTLC